MDQNCRKSITALEPVFPDYIGAGLHDGVGGAGEVFLECPDAPAKRIGRVPLSSPLSARTAILSLGTWGR